MNLVYQILGLIAAGAIIWVIYQAIKNRPDAFSKDNLNKSFFTLGILALVLIAFITLLVFLMRMV